MTNGDLPTLIYLRPSDPTRTAIAEYSEHFLSALRLIPGFRVIDLLPPELSERIDSQADRDAVREFVAQAVSEIPFSSQTIIHAEMGNALHREFWAAHALQQLLPRARFFCTLHDPPRLCSNPYRYVRTEFEGRTPLRLLNVALTRAAEWRVAWMKRRIEREFIEGCEAVVTLTQTARDLLKTLPLFAAKRVIRIPHVTRLDPLKDYETDQAVQVTAFGFLAPSKGIEELIEAFEMVLTRLKSEGHPIAPASHRLLVFGGVSQGFHAEDYVRSLRERIARSPVAPQIDFRPGFMADAERDALLRRADIMVLPFRAVPGVVFSSATAIQAMTRGKAIVAAQSPALAEEIVDGQTGLLCREGDSASLADCLHRLFVDQDLRVRLGANARAHIEAEHSPQRVAEVLQKGYSHDQ